MKRVYYISPVGTDPSYSSKREVLARIASDHGIEFFFPLDCHHPFSVPTTLTDLRDSQLVIADLSFERPSCYFEVGLAQATGTPVVLIASVGTPLHQAGGTERVQMYTNIASFQAAIEWALSHVPRIDA